MKTPIRHFLNLFIVASIVSFLAWPALAQQLVTFNFTGAITSVSGTPFGLSASIGEPVQGSFTYDRSLLPAYDTGTVAGYIQLPPSGMSMVISGVPIQSQDYNSFQVINNAYGIDNINGSFSPISVGSSANQNGSMLFSLSDTTQTALSSTALPTSLDFSKFDNRQGALFDFNNGGNLYFLIDVAPISIKIDIKPSSFPNSINPGDKGVIPVAILTTGASDNFATFDATTVDQTTVHFGSTGTEASPVHYALEDVDRDGDIDLILHFNTQDTGIKCGDTSATLTGATFDGTAIQGTDSIKTVGCN